MIDMHVLETPIGPTGGNGFAPVVTTRSPRMFSRIHDPHHELILWRRRLDPDLASWLTTLPAGSLPTGRLTVVAADVGPLLDEMFRDAATPAGAMRDLLRADLIFVASLFAEVMAVGEIDLRLEAIHGNACWKFHRDCVRARLLTTYCGPGTQWVEPTFAQAALEEQRDYRGPIRQFQLNDVGLFKGDCAPPASGIVHRSPPIAATGQTRLVLCLNLPPVVAAYV